MGEFSNFREMFFGLLVVVIQVTANCLDPPQVPSNQSWVFHDENQKIIFISNGAFRVRTTYQEGNTTCPYEFNFDPAVAKLSASKSTELQLTVNESTNSSTKMLDMQFNSSDNKYYLESILIHYSESAFIKNGSTVVKSIGSNGLKAFPTKLEDSYSCSYPAELQLNQTNDGSYGFVIWPAMWQGYSTFSKNQTQISNPEKCNADKVPRNDDHLIWELYSKNGQTVCGRIEMNALLHIDYRTLLGEEKSSIFSIPPDTKLIYDFEASPKDPSKCQDLAHNQSYSITWPITEIGENVANLTMTFDSEDGHNWLISKTKLSVLFGNNPLFPNSNITQNLIGSVESEDGLKFIQADMEAAFRCNCLADKWKIDCEHYHLPLGQIKVSNESHYAGLMIYNLTVQPTNIGPNGTYTTFEYCEGDVRGSMGGFWASVGIFSALAVSLLVVGVYETCGPEKKETGAILVIDNKNFDNIGDSEPQIVITAEADEPRATKAIPKTDGDNPNFKSSSAPQSASKPCIN